MVSLRSIPGEIGGLLGEIIHGEIVGLLGVNAW